MIHLAREGAVATGAVGIALLTVCAAPLGQGQNDLPRVPPSMMTFVAEPPPTRLHAGLPTPIKIADATPIYPAAARAADVAGDVVLEIVIDTRGRVHVERVLRSIPALDRRGHALAVRAGPDRRRSARRDDSGDGELHAARTMKLSGR